jgi:uncharacterized repeat protein (TIGR03803 family)
LVADRAGNLYGTTSGGGVYGYGVIFKITLVGQETVLHAFDYGNDGGSPFAGLVFDKAGNLYGTTTIGGRGFGTVFKMLPDGTFSIIHYFDGGTDGADPRASLIIDKKGNLFGTTLGGGTYHLGTVFKLTPEGTETILHSFGGTTSDGNSPEGPLIIDRKHNLYGTTYGGGSSVGWGTVFKVAADGSESILHAFAGGPNDGLQPYCGLVTDKAGNFYGTTSGGGTNDGTVFELTPDGTEVIVHSIQSGLAPNAGLIMDKKNNLYGTASQSFHGGSVFRLAPDGTETSLHDFKGGSDGYGPMGSLVFGSRGRLYGTTQGGGGSNNAGTVFEVKK